MSNARNLFVATASWLTCSILLVSTAAALRPQSQSSQAVTWSEVVNCSVSGNSLQKTGGRDDSYDAGAISAEEIASGDAFVEFVAADSTKALFCGLAHDPVSTHFEQIDSAIKLTSFGVAEVRENNVYRGETPYRAGDVFRVAVQSGQVGYYKNGGLFYSSSRPAVFPLRVDAALQSMGARIDGVSIGVAAAEPSADWTTYQHDERHTGFSPGSRIALGNVGGLSESWSFQT